jgi:hypothetical protein
MVRRWLVLRAPPLPHYQSTIRFSLYMGTLTSMHFTLCGDVVSTPLHAGGHHVGNRCMNLFSPFSLCHVRTKPVGVRLFPSHLTWSTPQHLFGRYRKHLVFPDDARNATMWIDFEAIQTTSVVYLNGKLLGSHGFGYTNSRYFLEPSVVNWGGADNVLAVFVDATQPDSWW